MLRPSTFPRRTPSALVLAAVAALWGVPPGRSQTGTTVSFGDPSAANDHSSLEMVSVFDRLPPSGYAPVFISVRNDSAQARAFTLTSSSGNSSFRRGHRYECRWEFTAPANSTSRHEFMAPVIPAFVDTSGYSSYSSYSPSANTGLDLALGGAAQATLSVPGRSSPYEPMAAFSIGVSPHGSSVLNARRKAWSGSGGSTYSSGHDEFACTFTADHLPSDWRGYSGLDFLALKESEWKKLGSGPRTAIEHWVRLGGTLDLYNESAQPGKTELADGRAAAEFQDAGYGQVRSCRSFGQELVPENQMNVWYPPDTVGSRSHYRAARFSVDMNQPWNTQGQIGERSFGDWKAGAILVLFGILVGPVNLFVWAKAGRRHRLFITTPIISAAAALALIAVILFKDGVGGSGARFVAVYLSPGSAGSVNAYVQQEQFARTGVLFGSQFSLKQPANVVPVKLAESQWTRLKMDPGAPAQRFAMTPDDTYAGDWFQSRSEQALAIESVASTRGRIELDTGGSSGAPVLRSSLATALEKVWYCDAQNKWWQSTGALQTGGTVTFVSANKAEFKIWLQSAIGLASRHLQLRLTADRDFRGHFFAVSSDADAEMMDTLKSIDWKAARTFIWGPLPK